MVIRFTAATVFCFLFSLHLHAQSMCLDLFKRDHVSLGEFAEIAVDIKENQPVVVEVGTPEYPQARTITKGQVALSARQNGSIRWQMISSLTYDITDNHLLFTRMFDRPEFYGQDIFPTLVETIFKKHINVQTITVTISGSSFQKYQTDLAATGDKKSAILTNPVYRQLARLGFSKIDLLTELNNNVQSFLRMTVRLEPLPATSI